jgi:hypothetical protein
MRCDAAAPLNQHIKGIKRRRRTFHSRRNGLTGDIHE